MQYGDNNMQDNGVRDSVTLLGLDLKITEALSDSPSLKCMEINGARSGIDGYREANGSDEHIARNLQATLDQFGKPVYIVGGPITDSHLFEIMEPSQLPQNWIHPDYRHRPRKWQRLFIRKAPESPEPRAQWEGVEAVVFNRANLDMKWDWVFQIGYVRSGYREFFNEGRVMLANSPGIEALARDKSLHSLIFESASFMIKDLSYSAIQFFSGIKTLHPDNEEFTWQIKANFGGEYVAVKPTKLSQGTGVEIMKLDDLLNGKIPKWANSLLDAELTSALTGRDYAADLLGEKRNEMYVQEFVPGHPVKNPATGEMHSASMRYIILMTSHGGQIQVHPIGGYWRLAPFPLNSQHSLNEMYIANLYPIEEGKKGAIPVPLGKAEEDFVIGQLTKIMPTAYRRMLEYEPHMLRDGDLTRYLGDKIMPTLLANQPKTF